MSLYVDSSALLERYVQEADSDVAEHHLLSDRVWIAARHTWVEVRCNLARLLEGHELAAAQGFFASDFRRTHVVELDEATCDLAAQIRTPADAVVVSRQKATLSRPDLQLQFDCVCSLSR